MSTRPNGITGSTDSVETDKKDDGTKPRVPGDVGKDKKFDTNWECLKDVTWGVVEPTIVGTAITVVTTTVVHPELKYSGDNQNGQKIPRSKSSYGRAVMRKGIGKLGVIGTGVAGVWGGIEAYAESKSCPAIF